MQSTYKFLGFPASKLNRNDRIVNSLLCVKNISKRCIQLSSKNTNTLLNIPTFQPGKNFIKDEVKDKKDKIVDAKPARKLNKKKQSVLKAASDAQADGTNKVAQLLKEHVADINILAKTLETNFSAITLSEDIVSAIMKTLMHHLWKKGSTNIRICTSFRLCYEYHMRKTNRQHSYINVAVLHEYMEVLMLGGYHYEAMAWYKLITLSTSPIPIQPTASTYEMLIRGMIEAESLDYLYFILADMKIRRISLNRAMKDMLFKLCHRRHDTLCEYAITMILDQLVFHKRIEEKYEVIAGVDGCFDIKLQHDFICDVAHCLDVLIAARQVDQVYQLWMKIKDFIIHYMKATKSIPYSDEDYDHMTMSIPSPLLRYVGISLMFDTENASALENMIISQLRHISSPSYDDASIFDVAMLEIQGRFDHILSHQHDGHHHISSDLIATIFAYLLRFDKISIARHIRSSIITHAHHSIFQVSPSSPSSVFKVLCESLSILSLYGKSYHQHRHASDAEISSFMHHIVIFTQELFISNDPMVANMNVFSIIPHKISYQQLVDGFITTPASSYHQQFVDMIDANFIASFSDILRHQRQINGIMPLFHIIEFRQMIVDDIFYENMFNILSYHHQHKHVMTLFDYYYKLLPTSSLSSPSCLKYPGLMKKPSIVIPPSILNAVIKALAKLKEHDIMHELLFKELPSKHVMISSDIILYAMEKLSYAKMFDEAVKLCFQWLRIDSSSYQRSLSKQAMLSGAVYTSIMMLAIQCCAKAFLGKEALSLLMIDTRNRAIKGELVDTQAQNRDDTAMFENIIIALSTASHVSNIPRVISMMEQGSKNSYALVPNQRFLRIALVAAMVYKDSLVIEYIMEKWISYGFPVNKLMIDETMRYAVDSFQVSEDETQYIGQILSAYSSIKTI